MATVSKIIPDNAHIPGEITALLAKYAHIIDSGRFEEWPNLFTDPCTYQITTRDNFDRGLPISIIICDSHGMLKDRVVSIRTANVFEPHRYRHIVSCIEIIGEAENEWHLRSNYLVTRTMMNGTMSVFSTGEYKDIIVQKEDKFLFRERVVICDHSVINNLIALPL